MRPVFIPNLILYTFYTKEWFINMQITTADYNCIDSRYEINEYRIKIIEIIFYLLKCSQVQG